MEKGNINGTLILLTNIVRRGILPLNEKTLNSFRQNHPKSNPAYKEIHINGKLHAICPIIFDDIKWRINEKRSIKKIMMGGEIW